MPSSLGMLVPLNCPTLLSLTRDSLRVPWDVSPYRSTSSATPSRGDPWAPLRTSCNSSQIPAERMMRRIPHEALERQQGPESRRSLLWWFVPSGEAREAMNEQADERK